MGGGRSPGLDGGLSPGVGGTEDGVDASDPVDCFLQHGKSGGVWWCVVRLDCGQKCSREHDGKSQEYAPASSAR